MLLLTMMSMVQEAQLRDQEREVALKEAEEESRLQEQVNKVYGKLTETKEHTESSNWH